MSAILITWDCSLSNVVGAIRRVVFIVDLAKTNTPVRGLRHVLSVSLVLLGPCRVGIRVVSG